AQAHNPYDEAETLEDVRNGLHVVRTLLRMGRYQQASDTYRGALSYALLANLEAHAQVLSLLRPLFQGGWATLPQVVDESDGAYLTNDAAVALDGVGETNLALQAYRAALSSDLRQTEWSDARVCLSNISISLTDQGHLARAERSSVSALDLAELTGDKEQIF